MGQAVTIPVVKRHEYYQHPDAFDSSGEPRPEFDARMGSNPFTSATEKIFEAALLRRQRSSKAKEKLNSLSYEEVRGRFPTLTYEQLVDFKAQFQIFDLNHDGLIDFTELCGVMDELGDRCSNENRRKYFDALDLDMSGAIDFEEYVTCSYQVIVEDKAKDSEQDAAVRLLASLCKSGTTNAQKLRKLSVFQQIGSGVF